MTLDLAPRYRQRLVELLAAEPRVRRIILFGSRARGDARPGSDVDLAVEGEHLTPETLAAMQTRLEESTIPYLVDLVPLDENLDPRLREHILADGISIYERDEGRGPRDEE